jgi:hypothetical protein
MRSLKTVRSKPLDDLVLKVHHIESLRDSQCLGDFLEGIRFMTQNLDDSLEALGGFQPSDAAERRMAERVKLSAMRLLQLCRAIPESFDNSDQWRQAAVYIAANYEQFRIDAGHLYQLAVPRAGFGVLRSAL